MAEFLSPGIFIEEVPSGNQAIEGVGTSTLGIVGWTTQGPVNEATLITSPQAYGRKFGTQTKDSLVPLSISAFFTNGGTRAYVVRVVPTDAAAASSCISNVKSSEDPAQPSGEVGASTSGSTITPAEDNSTVGPFTIQMSQFPVTSAAVTVNWTVGGTRATGTITTVAGALLIDAETFTISDGVNPPVVFEFNSGGGITTGNVAVPFTAGDADTVVAAAIQTAINGAANLQVTASSGGGAITNLVNDLVGTAGNVVITDTVADAGFTHTGMSTGADGTAKTATITGTSTIGGADATGINSATLNRTTGALSITFATSNAPAYDTVRLSYTYCQWQLDAANEGAWGNDVRVTLRGNDNFFVYAPATTTDAGTWTKYDLLVSVKNPDTLLYEVKETYEELVFDDASDTMYAPDVVNDASDLIVLGDNGDLAVPSTFAGAATSAESLGTGTGSQTAFTATLANVPVVKGSLVISYTDGTVQTITADASGNLVSDDLDATQTNTINYTTGAIVLNFKTANAPDIATAITAAYIKMPTTSSVNYDLAAGSDGTISTIGQSLVSSSSLATAREGMYALDRVDEMLQLIIPDFGGSTAVQGDMIDYAEGRRDVFAILSTPSGKSAQEAVDYLRITFARKSKYAAMYWPWIKVADPLQDNRSILMPPVAHVAGIYARTDNNKNVGKAPGGTIDGALRGLLGLERNPDKGERDTVYPARINPLINTPQTGMAVWGVRTLSSTNDAFKYVNAVRLFIFVEKSVFNATHSLVFESINSNLYTQIKTSLDSFLLNLYNTGHFAGNSPVQAFSVICDGSNNPPEVANAGQVVVDVAIAPNRPGEFIRFRFAQKTLS